jgi:hypothetical protein
MVFFDRINTPHREEAMNKLLERVDDWESKGNRTIVAWKWRHMEESMNPSRIYVEVEIMYRETIETFTVAGRTDADNNNTGD